MACTCFIVPQSVLERFSADGSLDAESRTAFRETAALEPMWRQLRGAHNDVTQARLGVQPTMLALAPAATAVVFTCNGSLSLPGAPVANPGASADGPAKRSYDEALAVANFYQTCFGRNSVDDAGKTLVSSVHYGHKYNNAFWNGEQMVYGDGDGQIFIDFTASNDVIGHELTHGVTQYTAGLNYSDEPGALNESISDVFGSMFRQWQANQPAAAADWLIGSGIMGPAARARGYTCLRDMANPAAAHCLSAQPADYAQYVPHGDPHVNSGIPNRAFSLVANAITGNSWEKAGKVWYAALTGGGANPNTNFRQFADLTRQAAQTLFPADNAVFAAVDNGWKQVHVS